MVGDETTVAGGLPGLPRREPYRTWPGSLIVIGVILVLVGALIVWDDNTSGAEPIEPGTTVEVGNGVSFVPADGWFLLDERTTPGSQATVASRGGTFTVEAGTWFDPLPGLVERTSRTILADGSLRLIGDGVSFHTDGGLTGTRLAFAGSGVQGRAWVAVDDQADVSVVVYASSPPETFQQVSGQVDAMIDSIRMNGADA
ncbi:MAG: hypothetical protein WBA97_10990 [Actinophytocola sp.]|uniref:hypothetical protein n=1 Tax=Actinophytocola sp. TaxID=1872138 RepID=UPI003C739847